MAPALALFLFSAITPAFAQQSPSVSVIGNKFVPDTLHVAAGTTVNFTNTGMVQHSVTADDGSFDSGMLAPGAAFSVELDQPGTYQYYCQAHGDVGLQGMSGTIVVDDSNAAPAQQRTPDDYQPTEMG